MTYIGLYTYWNTFLAHRPMTGFHLLLIPDHEVFHLPDCEYHTSTFLQILDYKISRLSMVEARSNREEMLYNIYMAIHTAIVLTILLFFYIDAHPAQEDAKTSIPMGPKTLCPYSLSYCMDR